METNQDNVVPAIVKVDIVNKIGPEGRESNSTMKVEGGLAEVQQQLDLAALSRGDARRAEGQWPGKFGWVAWVVAGVLAAVAILFLILFLVKDGDAEVDASTAPASAPVVHVVPTVSVPDGSLAAEANTRAFRAQDTANSALTVANTAMGEAERVGQDLAATDYTVGELVVAHPAFTPDACAQELESRWLMPGAPLQRMLEKKWLTLQQVKAKAYEECAR